MQQKTASRLARDSLTCRVSLHSSKMKLFIVPEVSLVTKLVVVWLIITVASAQVQAQGDHNLDLSLTALCSDKKAGVTWTDINVTSIYELDIIFNCTTPNMTVLTDDDNHDQPQCFKKSQDRLNIAQIRSRTDLHRRTHIIGRELDPGTVCTFSALLYNEPTLIRVSRVITDSCTVREPSTCESDPALCALPADCTNSDQGDQECNCSCNQDYMTGTPYMYLNYGGIICYPVEQPTNESTPSMESSSFTISLISTEGITPTSSVPEELIPKTTLSTQESATTVSDEPIPTTTLPTQESISTVIGDIITPVAPKIIPSQTNTPHPPGVVASTLKRVLPAFLFAFLLIATIILGLMSLGIFLLRRKHLKRLHTKLAVPFLELKLEKIDPDFNPIRIEKSLYVAESLQSIFHTFGTNPSLQIQGTTTKGEDYLMDYDDSSSNITETNSAILNVSEETECEETILEDVKHSPAASSTASASASGEYGGYVTITSLEKDHMYEQTTEMLESFAYDDHDHDTELPAHDCQQTSIESLLSADNMPSAASHVSVEAPHATVEASEVKDTSKEATDRVTTNMSGYIQENDARVPVLFTSNLHTSQLPMNHTDTHQVADYILPTFTCPEVHFTFPRDMS